MRDPRERDWKEWRRDTLMRLVCLLIGHAKPRRATQAWDHTRQQWFDVSHDANIVICGRCHRMRNSWSLTAR